MESPRVGRATCNSLPPVQAITRYRGTCRGESAVALSHAVVSTCLICDASTAARHKDRKSFILQNIVRRGAREIAVTLRK
jgi:hypothetical protein